MKGLIPIDELNVAAFPEFFGPMALDEEEKLRRRKLAEELLDMFVLLFVMMESEWVAEGGIDEKYYSEMLDRRYSKIAAEYGPLDEGMEKQILDKSINIVLSTARMAARGEPYAFSRERAASDGGNEANFIRNAQMDKEAKDAGLSNKTWRTMRDDKVRQSHRDMDGTTIGIDEWFNVNGSVMQYPMDTSMAPDLAEVVGCRCSLEYS